MGHWDHDIALSCPTPPRNGQKHRLPPIPGAPHPKLCPRHKSIVYKGCTLGVRGVRTGCTMPKPVGIRGASGVHPLYTVLRAHEYGLSISAAVSNGDLLKTGAGRLVLSGTNTVAGNVVVSNGVVAVAAISPLDVGCCVLRVLPRRRWVGFRISGLRFPVQGSRFAAG